MTLESRLKEIKERCDATTEGPWYKDDSGRVRGDFGFVVEEVYEERDPERNFIAHARTDIPMLLEMVYKLVDDRWSDLDVLEEIADKYR